MSADTAFAFPTLLKLDTEKNNNIYNVKIESIKKFQTIKKSKQSLIARNKESNMFLKNLYEESKISLFETKVDKEKRQNEVIEALEKVRFKKLGVN